VQEQAKLLKLGKLNALDLKNLIEKIESLGKQQKQKLISAWLSNWGETQNSDKPARTLRLKHSNLVVAHF